MPPSSQNIPLASTLVARFLRTNNYTQTLKAFLQEAGLPSDAGEQRGKDDTSNWTIENVLEEKKAFDQSKNFERYGDNDKDKDVWTVPGLYNTSMPCSQLETDPLPQHQPSPTSSKRQPVQTYWHAP